VYIAIGLVSSLLMLFLLKRENGRRDRGERKEWLEDDISTHLQENVVNGRYANVEEARRIKGDEWSGYRYRI